MVSLVLWGNVCNFFLRCEAIAELAVIVAMTLVRSIDWSSDSHSLSGLIVFLQDGLWSFHSTIYTTMELSILTKLCCWGVLGGGR